jgi:predicted flap endonuclease-1-like 5' DNA nuclease
MGYLLAEILACLALAGLIGTFIGWWLRGGCKGKIDDNTDDAFKLKDDSHATQKESIEEIKIKHDAKLKSEHDFYNSKIKNIESDYDLKLKKSQNEIEALKTELNSTKTELTNTNDTWKLKLKDHETKLQNEKQSFSSNNDLKNDSEIKRLNIELAKSKDELKKSNDTWGKMLKDTESKWEHKVAGLAAVSAGAAAVAKTALSTSSDTDTNSNYKLADNIQRDVKCHTLEDIQGLGPGYAKRFKKRGIQNSCDLADKYLTDDTATHKASKKLRIDFDIIRSWASMADLMKIDGVSGVDAEIMQAVGINSREELVKIDIDETYQKMSKLDEKNHNITDIPSLSNLRNWIESINS